MISQLLIAARDTAKGRPVDVVDGVVGSCYRAGEDLKRGDILRIGEDRYLYRAPVKATILGTVKTGVFTV